MSKLVGYFAIAFTKLDIYKLKLLAMSNFYLFFGHSRTIFLHMSKQGFFSLKTTDYWTFYNTSSCICPKQNITSFHSVVCVKCRPSRLPCCELRKAFCVFC